MLNGSQNKIQNNFNSLFSLVIKLKATHHKYKFLSLLETIQL